MGAQVRYGTIAVGAYGAHMSGRHQPSFTDQYDFKWDRGGARSLSLRSDPGAWSSKWSYGCKIGYGDVSGADGAAGAGQDMALQDFFNPPVIQDGCQSLKFILGTCKDSAGAAVANAIVQSFRTSDDSFLYEVTGAEDGTYRVPTPHPSPTTHYLVAYKSGSPDIAGTTVNTLVSTNIDGT